MELLNKPTFNEKPEIEKIIVELKNYYVNDERPFAIGFSGGKDSTVTADLVMKALLRVENPTKPIYLTISDTKLEMDNTIANINQSLENLREFAEKYNIPLTIKRVEPIPTESYMYLLAGRGYSVPRRDNRWCTDRLKLRPQQREEAEMRNLHSGGYLNVVGTRRAESPDRASRIEKNTINGMYKIHDNDRLSNVLMPVEHMSDDDIWTYLYTYSSEWVDGVALGKVYAEANQNGDKECSTLLEGLGSHSDYKAGCSNSARYGCWICTLFEKDKTLNSLATQYDYMTHMEEFRNWLTGFRDGEWGTRDLYNHRDHTEKKYDKKNHRFGMTNVGGYTLEFRKMIVDRLLDLDTQVFPERGIRIITDEELMHCQQAWVLEGDVELSLLQMLQDKQGRTIELTDETHDLIYLAKLVRISMRLNENREDPSLRLSSYFHGKMSDRFYVQFALQLKERTIEPFEILKAISMESNKISEMDAIRIITALPAFSKQFFPTQVQENIIRSEWDDDRAYFHTTEALYWKEMIDKPESNLFGHDGVYGDFFDCIDKNIAIDESSSFSLEEQIAFFDNWREEDRKELTKQMRTNVQKGRDPYEGIDEQDNLVYEINMKSNTATALYSPDGDGHFYPVAKLSGKDGVIHHAGSDELPASITNMIEDKNEELTVAQLRDKNRLKREEVKEKTKSEQLARQKAQK